MLQLPLHTLPSCTARGVRRDDDDGDDDDDDDDDDGGGGVTA